MAVSTDFLVGLVIGALLTAAFQSVFSYQLARQTRKDERREAAIESLMRYAWTVDAQAGAQIRHRDLQPAGEEPLRIDSIQWQGLQSTMQELSAQWQERIRAAVSNRTGRAYERVVAAWARTREEIEQHDRAAPRPEFWERCADLSGETQRLYESAKGQRDLRYGTLRPWWFVRPRWRSGAGGNREA